MLVFNSSRKKWRRRQWQPTPVLLPGKSHGRRSLVGCRPLGREESDTTERPHFHFSLSCIGEGNGNPLQCFCLENPKDGGAWWAAVYGVTQSRTWLKWLSSSSSSSSRKKWFSLLLYILAHWCWHLCLYENTQTRDLSSLFNLIMAGLGIEGRSRNVTTEENVCSVTQSYLTLCGPHGLQPTSLLCPWNFPDKKVQERSRCWCCWTCWRAGALVVGEPSQLQKSCKC